MDIEESVDINISFSCQSIPDNYERIICQNPHRTITESEIKKHLNDEQIKLDSYKDMKGLRMHFKSKELRLKMEQIAQNIPGRKEEAIKIFDFISISQNGSSAPLCLHGISGCGKTSLVTKILDFFKQNSQSLSVAYLNCMRVFTIKDIYSGILKQLFGLKQKKSKILLDKLFNNCYRSMDKKLSNTKIIVLDEVDQFINDQSFTYNLLNWMGTKGSKIILIFISNRVDLTSELDPKLISRMKFQTMIFKQYSFHQIQQIIRYKYPYITSYFQKNAITYLAKKIANKNSDIRQLEKNYHQAIAEFNRINQNSVNRQLITTQMINSLMAQKKNQFQKNYQVLIKILKNPNKKVDISEEVIQRMFIKYKRRPDTQQMMLIFCDMKDAGLLNITSNKKNANFIFQNYGIKVLRQNLDLLAQKVAGT